MSDIGAALVKYTNSMIVCIGNHNLLVEPKTKAVRTVELSSSAAQIAKLVPDLHVI